MAKVQLGDRVRDVVSGFTGIATGYASWLTGCDQVSVRGPVKEGKLGESYWFDVHAVKVLERGAVKITNPAARDNGGPPTPSPK